MNKARKIANAVALAFEKYTGSDDIIIGPADTLHTVEEAVTKEVENGVWVQAWVFVSNTDIKTRD